MVLRTPAAVVVDYPVGGFVKALRFILAAPVCGSGPHGLHTDFFPHDMAVGRCCGVVLLYRWRGNIVALAGGIDNNTALSQGQ